MLQQNFERLGQPLTVVAQQLKTTPANITAILNLDDVAPEAPWILREYLNEALASAHQTAIPYSKLTGDYHQYWFLDSQRIERKQLN